MAGRTDPDSVRIEITRDRTGEVFTPPAAARDQIAAWMDDPTGPASIRVTVDGGSILTLVR